MSTPV
jgi:hypothetical protein